MIAVTNPLNDLTRTASKRKSLQFEKRASLRDGSFVDYLKVPSVAQPNSPPLTGKELNPLQSNNSTIRPRSLHELKSSSLFMDSEGSAEARLSILFAEPSSVRSHRRPKSVSSLPSPQQSPISLTLSGNDAMLDVYRENAKKTNDPKIQLEFGKYLLTTSRNLMDVMSPNFDLNASKKLEREGIFCIKRMQKMNYPEAIFIVASWHENEQYGYEKSESKSASLYLSAAKLGYPPAMDKIGYHYEKKKDFTRAIAYYKKAAALADPSANYRLGVAYIYSEMKLGVNYKNAQFYLRRSAIEANQSCPRGAYVWALILLGIYEVDLHIRDATEGRDYLVKAANLNYSKAQNKVGFCFEFGEHGFPIDPAFSIEYYTHAAKAGHPESQLALSGWHFTGAPNNLKQDDKMAYFWCKLAADQHLAKAEYAMGHYHEVGVGTEKDMDAAMLWYKKAAKNGSKEAENRLNQADLASALSRSVLGSIRSNRNKKTNKDKGSCVIS